MGNITSQSISTLFTIGYTQTQAINFQGAEVASSQLAPSWASSKNESDLVSYFYKDHPNAVKESNTLDNKVESDSVKAAGKEYSIITTLAARQLFGGLQFTGTDSSTLIFLKEISSDGDISTVDVLFPSFPGLSYFNSDLIKYSLEPLYIYQESGAYPNQWAIHDLGVYPNALGYPDGTDEMMPLEECGNMIIMSLAYAQRENDNSWLKSHYTKLTQWTEYLGEEAKIPADQLSTNDFAGHLA